MFIRRKNIFLGKPKKKTNCFVFSGLLASQSTAVLLLVMFLSLLSVSVVHQDGRVLHAAGEPDLEDLRQLDISGIYGDLSSDILFERSIDCLSETGVTVATDSQAEEEAGKMSVYPLPPSRLYTYQQFVHDLEKLRRDFPHIVSLSTIGNSVEGVPIHMIRLGRGDRNILVVGSLHAREWINTPVLMESVRTYARDYYSFCAIQGEPIRYILDRYSLYIVPLANPDGMKLQQFGADAFPARRNNLIRINRNRTDFTRWKANIRGVDLNRNWNVQWNVPKRGDWPNLPSPENHKGPFPESEPEVRAIADWVRANNPELILDYHSSGEIFFWYYYQTGNTLAEHRKIVDAMVSYSGYRAEEVDTNKPAGTHLARWGVMVRNIPAVVVENGVFTNRYQDMSNFNHIMGRVWYLIPVAIINTRGYVRYVPVGSVSLNYHEITMAVGDSLQLVPTIAPANASYRDVTWSSSNENVAAVNQNGLVQIRGVGTATIRVVTQDGGKEAFCQINVPYVPPERVELNHDSVTLYLNGARSRVTLRAEVYPANTSDKSVQWHSSDNNTVTVNNMGRVESLREGVATVTVVTVDGHLVDSCIIEVIDDGIMYGDTNDDKAINVKDAILMLRYIVGFAGEINEQTADITGDGLIRVIDAVALLRYIVGL